MLPRRLPSALLMRPLDFEKCLGLSESVQKGPADGSSKLNDDEILRCNGSSNFLKRLRWGRARGVWSGSCTMSELPYELMLPQLEDELLFALFEVPFPRDPYRKGSKKRVRKETRKGNYREKLVPADKLLGASLPLC